MTMKLLLSMLTLSLLFSIGCQQQKSEWGKWRGPNGDNVSIEKGWSAVNLDSANVLWRKDIGFGHGAFVVRNKKCYITGWNETVVNSDTTSASTVYCLNTKNGEMLWSFSTPAAKRGWTGPRATPTLDGNNLYHLTEEGKLFCLNAESGKEVWTVDMAADSLAVVNDWGYSPSPVIAGNLILFNMNEAGIAIDKNSGKVVWNSNKKIASFATAKLFDFNGKPCALFQADSTLRIVDIADGSLEYAFQKKKTAAMSNDVQITRDGNIYASDEFIKVENGELKSVWNASNITSWFLTGVVVGDYAYQFGTAKGKNTLNCIELKTGELKWAENMGQYGQLIAVDSKLMIVTGIGKVVIADASPEGFNKLAELQVLTAENKDDYRCMTAPAFLDGKLYIRNFKGEVACINLK
jgi:outer membrane protein assembly factor BamB